MNLLYTSGMQHRNNLYCLLCLFITLTNCGVGATTSSNNNDESNSSDRATQLTNVQSWLYQLQNINPTAVGASLFDLAVVDYSRDGSDEEKFTAANVATMQGSDDTQKLVVAYMSIGEAEDYRYYFDENASYMDGENPDWPGNFKVHYWETEWQDVIDSYIDEIIEAGFDGAYLDIIDAYEYYGPGGDSGLERASAAADMVSFVIHIADYAHEQDPDFLIIPQNGAAIITASGMQTEYFTAINGIGVEDTFYFGDDDEDNPLDEQTAVIDSLDTFVANGKTVLSVDYLTDESLIDDYYTRATAKSYVPYATVRALDALTMNSGHEPE